MGANRRSHYNAHGSRSERGSSLLGVLSSVIVLGVLVVIMFSALGGSPKNSDTGTTSSGVTTTSQPTTPESGAALAAVSACRTNYQSIETALSEYRSLNGTSPTGGSSWATAATNGGPYLQVWPESALYYSIVWTGSQLNVIPVRGASSHGSVGTSSPKSGCFAA